MNGTVVGKRVIGAQAPVTIGWENVPRVEGGPVKQFVFTWFQPVMLFGLISFWYYAPNSIAKASTAVGIGIGFKALLLALEWVNPRFDSWRLTWKEAVTDLFYVSLGYTALRIVDGYIGSDAVVGYLQDALQWDKLTWFMTLPLLVQALLISLVFDFGQYWMHRSMHNWHPLWLTHAPHHYITQLNVNKGAVGNPVELFLIGLGIGGFFDFLPRAALLAGTFGLAVGTYQSGVGFGITLMGPMGSDRSLIDAATAFFPAVAIPPPLDLEGRMDTVKLAVVGAHLKDMPLHWQLTSRDARFVEETTTAPAYRLYAMANSVPPKPALVHSDDGAAIAVEIYELDIAAFGSFVAEVPPPLAIGTVTLADGSLVKGFVAEPRATTGAEDITALGGWRRFLQR